MNVGLYYAWDEPFEQVLTRMAAAAPHLIGDCYRDRIRFVPPYLPHSHALVFNGVDTVHCPLNNTFVILFEPVEILHENNVWLHSHPLDGAHIYSFCGGTKYEKAMGLHLVQARRNFALPKRKPLLCSMICSDKNDTPYHKKRREVLAGLIDRKHLDIDFYGRNMHSEDPRVKGEVGYWKDPALYPYRFTIDFENAPDDVLTDKFIDPILNCSVPITNSTAAGKIFSTDSFEYVDFNEPVDAIVANIEDVISTFPSHQYADLFETRYLLTEGEYNLAEWIYRKVQ